MNENEKADTEERFGVAANASNLRVDGVRHSSADMHIAAGWIQAELGVALLRLRSEWHVASKPIRPATMNDDAAVVYHSQLMLLAARLVGRERVWLLLQPELRRFRADASAGAVALLHWLDPNCPLCEGRGVKAHGAGPCGKCSGSGLKRASPAVSRVIAFLEKSVYAARQKLANRLR
jgi:hypothetical protein